MIALHVAQLCNKVAVFLVDSAFIGFPPGKFKQCSLAVVTTGKTAMVNERVQIRAPWLLRGYGEGCHGY